MLKKYLPYLFLIASALLFFYIKKNQRGEVPKKPETEERISIPVIAPENNPQKEIEDRPDDKVVPGFNRNATKIIFSKHARCRMDCRNIDESEIREILKNGTVNVKKIQEDKRGMIYPVEGMTHDKQHVRVVFAPKDDGLVVVTVIDLGKEWSCDCK